MMTKFNVGDKVRITEDLYIRLIGKEGVITEDDGTSCAPYSVKLEDGSIQRKFGKYLALVTPSTPPKPKKSARITALETQVATLQAKVEALESAVKYPLTAQFELQNAEVDGILADIKRKAKPTLEALLATYPSQQTRVLETPNQLRWGTIQRAKAYVAKWTKRAASITREVGNSALMNRGSMTTEFIVNAEKRTVVCLAKSNVYGDIRGKGIAKCDTDDVFNADIGKAIALARALGVEVPTEFVKAVQPTEVVVGMVVSHNNTKVIVKPPGTYSYVKTGDCAIDSFIVLFQNPQIIEDTNAVYK